MKKSIKGAITFLVILAVIIISIAILNQDKPETSDEIAKCIGRNSVVYSQLGCHACKEQQDLFGESYQYVNEIDCWYEREACIEKQITATPTWIIKGEKYVGVQSIEKLRELTNC